MKALPLITARSVSDLWFKSEVPVVFHFKVDFGPGSSDTSFQEVTGLSAEVTVEEFREGGLNQYTHKLPTGTKYGNLVLKRGYIKNSEVGDWCRKAIEDFIFEPRDISVTLLNSEHQPLVSWKFIRAWPVKWSISEFKSQENGLAIESLELAYSMFRRG